METASSSASDPPPLRRRRQRQRRLVFDRRYGWMLPMQQTQLVKLSSADRSLQLLYNMDTSQSPVDFPCSMKKVMLASTFQQ
uniref:Uncharacterized protein n=1 Tax=Oryza glumipatula TaxID=40148 RepID=A0A0E0AHW2_9ORYZ